MPQTVLLHESVRPPLSFRCPDCGGEITIAYAGAPHVRYANMLADKADQRGQEAQTASVVASLERGSQLSTAQERESLAAEPEIAGDPFGWKKRAR